MPLLAEVRAKYPQYKDMSDDELESGLYRKFYSDMSRAEFHSKVAARDIVSEMSMTGPQQEGLLTAHKGGAPDPTDRMGYGLGEWLFGNAEKPRQYEGMDPALRAAGAVPEALVGKMAGDVASLPMRAMAAATSGAAPGSPELTKAIIPTAAEAAMTFTPGAPKGVRAMPSPALSPQRRASVDYLASEGITPTAGQTTGSNRLKRAESSLGTAPGSGGAAERESERVAGEFTAAVNRRMGVEAERATPEVIQDVRKNLSKEFESSTKNMKVEVTSKFLDDIRGWTEGLLKEGFDEATTNRLIQQKDNILGGFVTGTKGNPPTMTGKRYHSEIKYDSPLNNAVHAGGDISKYAKKLRDILDDALEATATKRGTKTGVGMRAALDEFREARRKYANMVIISKAVSGAGEGTAAGYVSPQRLRAVLTGGDDAKINYAAGRGDLNELAHAGNEVLTPLPTSQTSERIATHGVPIGMASAVGLAATGNLPAAAGAAVLPFTPGLAGRALLSKPVQNYIRSPSSIRGTMPLGPSRLGGMSVLQGQQPQPQPSGDESAIPPNARPSEGTIPPDIQRLMQQPMAPSSSAQRQAMPLGKGRGQTVGEAVTGMWDTVKTIAKRTLMLEPEPGATFQRRQPSETTFTSPLGTTQEDVQDAAQLALMTTAAPAAATAALRPIMKLAAQHPYIAGNVAGLITTIASSSQASVETDRPAESFEVPLPEPAPTLVKSREAIQTKMDAADEAFQKRAQGSYRTQKAREIDASTHKDAMTGFRDELKTANDRITTDQDKRKREAQGAAKAQADIAAAKAERERPLTDKYPALMALPYLGAAYSGAVSYAERARQMQRYNDWAKRFNSQVANVDRMNKESEAFGGLTKKAQKTAPNPSGQSIKRETDVMGEFVKGADEAKKIIEPGVAMGAYNTAGRVVTGSIIATELAAVPSLIDLIQQGKDTKAYEEAHRKLKTLDGWLGTLQSTMTAGLVGASIGGTLPVQKQMMPNMERARVLGQPNAMQGVPAGAQPAGVPPGIMPNAWRQRQQPGQSIQ